MQVTYIAKATMTNNKQWCFPELHWAQYCPSTIFPGGGGEYRCSWQKSSEGSYSLILPQFYSFCCLDEVHNILQKLKKFRLTKQICMTIPSANYITTHKTSNFQFARKFNGKHFDSSHGRHNRLQLQLVKFKSHFVHMPTCPISSHNKQPRPQFNFPEHLTREFYIQPGEMGPVYTRNI